MKSKPRIALIADEFTRMALEPEADLIYLTPGNWYWQLLGRKKPDCLLVESAWRGYGDRWKGKIASPVNGLDESKKYNRSLEMVVEWFRKRQIPTLFWNKEDPVCFVRFAKAASLFDVIYTTDSNSEERYRTPAFRDAKFIGTLPFAVQPKLFYPDDRIRRLPGVAFAGGYYDAEYPQRSQQQESILTALTDMPLNIYDRFWQQGTSCSFPESLRESCRPAVQPIRTTDLFRRYQLYLNFNTVTDSPTMLSRRVFEIAACASPMVSTPSPALTRLFGDAVPQVTDGKQARYWCHRLLKDHVLRQKTGRHLYEQVMNQHTWNHRLQQISRETGIF